MAADATLIEAFEGNGSRRRDRVFALERRLAVIGGFFGRGRFGGFGRRGGIGRGGGIRGRFFVGAEDGASEGDRRRGDAEGDEVAFAAVERRDFSANAFRFAGRKERVERAGVRLRGVLRSGVVRGDLALAVRVERKRALAASRQAVEANDATRRVDLEVLNVDAGAFASLRAKTATDAFFGVQSNFEERKFRKRAQNRSDRANGIAVKATVTSGENKENREGNEPDSERRPTFRRRGNVNERVTSLSVGDRRENVVAEKVKRFQNRDRDSAEDAVRLQEREERKTERKRRDGEDEKTDWEANRNRGESCAVFARMI